MNSIKTVSGYISKSYIYGYSVKDIDNILNLDIMDDKLKYYIDLITIAPRKYIISNKFGLLEVYSIYLVDINKKLKDEYNIIIKDSDLVKITNNKYDYYPITSFLNSTIQSIKTDYEGKIKELEIRLTKKN